MKRMLLVLGFVGLNGWTSPYIYHGEFGSQTSSSPECEAIFSSLVYDVTHSISGSTGHTSVLHFRSPVPPAFFDGVTFVGLLGASGEYQLKQSRVKVLKKGRFSTLCTDRFFKKSDMKFILYVGTG